MTSDITVILLFYKTPKNLIKNLKVYKDFKIIILDQSNDTELKGKIEKILPNITGYYLSIKNLGFAKGINFLVKKVTTDYFLCTQLDVKINFRVIKNLKKTLITNNKNAIISVPLINKKIELKKDKITKSMIGACFMSKTTRFKKIGMFDEDFFFYWEDVELSKRIENTRYKIFISRKAKITHKNSNSTINTLSIYFIRNKNFIFGELLFDYKMNNLKKIKIVRKLLLHTIYAFFYFFLLNRRKLIFNIANIFGIFSFINFNLKKFNF